jgi:lipopolysaccharide export system protein LptA
MRQVCALAVLALGVAVSSAGLAEAASRGVTRPALDDDVPIEIFADGGVEWERKASVIQAVGNARAVRGDAQVRADVLRAYYRETPERGTQMWRLEATGGVVLSRQPQSAYGERAVYDIEQAILVLSGGDRVRLVGEDAEISADQQVEYWEATPMLVARGNAEARRGDRSVRADVLVAHLTAGDGGESRLDYVEAFDNVVVTTSEDRVTASYGRYDAGSAKAALTGDVKITRRNNQLNGCRAEVDLNSGLSKLLSCPPGQAGSGARVHGLIVPEQGSPLVPGRGGKGP